MRRTSTSTSLSSLVVVSDGEGKASIISSNTTAISSSSASSLLLESTNNYDQDEKYEKPSIVLRTPFSAPLHLFNTDVMLGGRSGGGKMAACSFDLWSIMYKLKKERLKTCPKWLLERGKAKALLFHHQCLNNKSEEWRCGFVTGACFSSACLVLPLICYGMWRTCRTDR